MTSMVNMRNVAWRLAATAAFVTSVSVGCAATPTTEGEGLTPGESKAELSALMDSIEASVGGVWSVTTLEPRECSLSGMAGHGVQWAMARNAPGAGDMNSARSATEKVSDLLADAGYEVTPATLPKELGYDLGGNNGVGSEVSWAANDSTMELMAGSNCVAGNVDDY